MLSGSAVPLRCDPKLFTKDLTGKVVIVTGGTGGIGLCTAEQLIKQKATVVVAGRSVEPGTKVAKEIGAVFMKLDLTSLQSVRDFAAAFLSKYDRLDVLVNNAGVMMPPSLARTKDDFELQMGTNHFSHFLLTELFREILERSAPSRVVVLASCASAKCDMAPFDPKMDFGDLNWSSRKYQAGSAYAQSKLANVLHAMEIAKRYKGVTAYSLHPGWVQSGLVRTTLGPCACCQCCVDCCAMRCMGDMINVWDGSQTSLHCILAEPSELENGAFYSQFGVYADKYAKPGGWPLRHPNAEVTAENATRLWEESVSLVGLGSTPAGAQATTAKAPLMQGMEIKS